MVFAQAFNLFIQSVILRRVKQYVRMVTSARARYAALSDDEIRAVCRALVDTPKIGSGRQSQSDVLRLGGYDFEDADAGALALTLEAFSRFPPEPLSRGAELYDQQVLAAVHLMIGSLVEMDTGEGKTFAIMAAALALLRRYRQVVVVTANPYLAARDAAQCGVFWGALNISVGLVLPMSYPTDGWSAWEASVVYTTAETFVFAHMESDLEALARDRPTTDAAVLLDEADSILLEKLVGDFFITRSTVPTIKNWAMPLHVAERLEPHHVERIPGSVAVILTAQGEAEIDKLVSPGTADEGPLMMLHDVELAYAALNVAIEGHDYKVVDDTIVPLDPTSGWPRMFATPDWLPPLAQHLRTRQQLLISREHVVCGIDVLRGAPHVAGASGTLIGEALDYVLLLNMLTVAIPPRRPRQQQTITDRFFATTEYAVTYVARMAAEAAPHRPVLVMTRSTHDADELVVKIRDQVDDEVDVRYAAANTIAGESLFENAGRPGVVLVSTQVAGRGVDIRLTEEARKAGGTLLIMLGHSEEARVDRQMLGRVGRGGDPYSAHYVNSFEDPILRQLPVPIRGVWESMGDAGGSSAMAARGLRAFQRIQRKRRLQRFASDVSRGRADAEGHAFIGKWYRKLQESGTKDHCGPEFLEALTTELAERLVPELADKPLSAAQATTIAQLAAALTDDPSAETDLLAALPGQGRTDAVPLVAEALRSRLTEPLIRNRLIYDEIARYDESAEMELIGEHVQAMLTAAVVAHVDAALDDDAPNGWNRTALEQLHDLYPASLEPSAFQRPENGWEAPHRDAVRAAYLTDARLAYRRREHMIDAVVGAGGMRTLEWQIVTKVLSNAYRDGMPWQSNGPMSDEQWRAVATDIIGFLFAVEVELSVSSGTEDREIEAGTTVEVDAVEPEPAEALPEPPEDDAPAVEESAAVDVTAPTAVVDTPERAVAASSFLGRLVIVLRPSRTSRVVAYESIAGAADRYYVDGRRRALRVWQRHLHPMKQQHAYAEARRDASVEGENWLLEQMYRNLSRAGHPEELDELFMIREHWRYRRPPRLDSDWRVGAPPAGTTGSRPHRVPTDQAGLILYFMAGLEAAQPKRAPSREQLQPVLNLLLRETPLSALSDPTMVREALQRYQNSDLRKEAAPWRRRRLDRGVRAFFDFLFEHGMAAQRPRGLRATAVATLRRLRSRLVTPRTLFSGATFAGLLASCVALALFRVSAGTRFPPALGVLDHVYAGGMVEAGRALGLALLPTMVAAFVTWVINGTEDVRGAVGLEHGIFAVTLVATEAWFVVSASPHSVGYRIGIAVVLAVLALAVRNASWLIENMVQLRVLCGLMAVFCALTAVKYLPGAPWHLWPAMVFGGVVVAQLATVPLRRGTVAVDTLIVGNDDTGELLAAGRKLTVRLGWQAFTFAAATAWLAGTLARRSATWQTPVEAAVFLAILALFAVYTARSATDETLWRKRLRSANQAYHASAADPTLPGRLRRLRRQVRVRELAVAAACLTAALALIDRTGSVSASAGLDPGLVAILEVTLATACCDFGRGFVHSVAALLGPGAASIPQVTDEQEAELTASVQYILRRIARWLSIVLFVFLVLTKVSDLLSVWGLLHDAWQWIKSIF